MSSTILPNDFDWKFYLKNNRDLIIAGINTEEDVIRHFLNHEQFEGRKKYSKLPDDFDWEFYLNYYEDLTKAGIKTKENAIKHYLNHGISENRLYKKDLLPNNNKVYDLTISGEIREEDGLENFNGINLCGFVNNTFGLGEYSRKIKKSLEKLSINHNTTEIVAENHHYEKIFETTKINNYNKNLLVFNPTELSLVPKDYYLNKYNIGVWFWELPHLPKDWIKLSTNYSEIWAPTNFIYEVLKKDLPKNVILKKINFPVLDPIKLDKNDSKKHFNINEDEFLCLFIFDYSSDFYRKNPFAVIETFKRAFSNNEKCKLIVKSQNGSKKQIQDIKDFIVGDNRVIFINEPFTKDRINILLNSSDVYISLHRSEGLGLTIMESILLEKPTLCTNYSGNLDFCLPEWCELVDYKLIQIDHKSIYKHYTTLEKQQWAEPSIDDAVVKLKKIYENQQEYVEKAKIGRKFILEKYDENVFNEQIKNLK